MTSQTASSPGSKSNSSLLSSQSSPLDFKELKLDSSQSTRTRHQKQSKSDELASSHLPDNDRLKLARRHTEPSHTLANTKYNNYYSQIRFYRQNNFSHTSQIIEANKPFPDAHKIQNYIKFREKYRFIMQNGNRKLLGFGAMSHVYKVYLHQNRSKKYACKISSYKNSKQKEQIMQENRLMHRFGNGLYVKDIYDDTLNKRLIFIMPNGKDMKKWWNGDSKGKVTGVKHKFFKETPKKQEWILKKVIYQILKCLGEIHSAGYIHHDIKLQNIVVTKKRNDYDSYMDYDDYYRQREWIDKYTFHIIDYGLTIMCPLGDSIELGQSEIRFGTFGYNAWELMQTHMDRKYNHSIDLYALGITLCELVIGQHILRHHNDFKRKQEDFCYAQLIDKYGEQERYFERECEQMFYGFTEYDIYAQTLRLKCEYWRTHFQRRNGVSLINGDESSIRSIVIKALQYKTPYTTRFKNFISNIIRDSPKRRIGSVDMAMNHDLFYNI